MNLGDFTPGGRYAAGGLAQQQAQPQMPSMAAPQNPQEVSGPLAKIPMGLLEVLARGQQVGFGRAFLEKYGNRFETLDNADALAGLAVQSDPQPQEPLSEYIEGDELDELTFEEAALGALAQVRDNLITGGLIDV